VTNKLLLTRAYKASERMGLNLGGLSKMEEALFGDPLQRKLLKEKEIFRHKMDSKSCSFMYAFQWMFRPTEKVKSDYYYKATP
jgi:hypothetical protein